LILFFFPLKNLNRRHFITHVNRMLTDLIDLADRLLTDLTDIFENIVCRNKLVN
jgi:hypothetical protein